MKALQYIKYQPLRQAFFVSIFLFHALFLPFLKVIPGVDFIINKADSTIMRKLFLLFTSFKREPKGFDFYLIFNLL